MLARTGDERYARLTGEVADMGNESVADLLSDVSHAKVARDVNEVRDIVAAERRITTGRYGVCIDCGASIGYKRLTAYPTAKRCFEWTRPLGFEQSSCLPQLVGDRLIFPHVNG